MNAIEIVERLPAGDYARLASVCKVISKVVSAKLMAELYRKIKS